MIRISARQLACANRYDWVWQNDHQDLGANSILLIESCHSTQRLCTPALALSSSGTPSSPVTRLRASNCTTNESMALAPFAGSTLIPRLGLLILFTCQMSGHGGNPLGFDLRTKSMAAWKQRLSRIGDVGECQKRLVIHLRCGNM